MEIIFLQAISGTALTFVILLGMRLISLVNTVNKQQEQINSLKEYKKHVGILYQRNVDITEILHKIANKVISIEERVDNMKIP